jgi:glycerate-2-kinase
MLSGGTSALLVSPAPGLSLESKRKVNELLIRSGAAIQEMNAVRKHLSRVKGGRLGTLLSHVNCVVVVVSDVIGDDPATIGSGPFYPDPTTFLDARGILEHHHIWNEVPAEAREFIEAGIRQEIAETPKSIVPPIPHRIIASNRTACVAARDQAVELGYHVKWKEEPLSGMVEEVASYLAREIQQAGPKTALIFGGEITVRVRGTGTGGRNQHLALLMTEKLKGVRAQFAAAGTDGIDGNSPAAGAWTDGQTLERAAALGLDYQKSLETFDSHAFFERLGQTIRTGPTGTNVMDLYAALTEN